MTCEWCASLQAENNELIRELNMANQQIAALEQQIDSLEYARDADRYYDE